MGVQGLSQQNYWALANSCPYQLRPTGLLFTHVCKPKISIVPFAGLVNIWNAASGLRNLMSSVQGTASPLCHCECIIKSLIYKAYLRSLKYKYLWLSVVFRHFFFSLTASKTGSSGCLETPACHSLHFSTCWSLLITTTQTLDVDSSWQTYLSQLWSGRSSLSPSPGWWGNQQSARRLVAQCGSTPWWPMSCWARRCKTTSAWQQSDRDAKPGQWAEYVVSKLVPLL